MPLIEAATLHGTLEEAVADCAFVVGTTARARSEGRNYVRPRTVAPEIVARAAEGRVAILFGREDKGLFNDGLDLCHLVAIIPTDAEYPSLNLAQACLVMAYETFLAAGGGAGELPRAKRSTRAPKQEELESAYRAVELGLASVDFFKGSRSPRAVMRTVRTLVARAGPDLRETRLLAAMGFEVGHYIERLRASLSPVPSREQGAGTTAERGDS
jgi:TrmH family RNA methyltransferase